MTSLPSDRKPKRIQELDGLRAFAVIFVVIFHMSDFAGSLPQAPFGISKVVSCLGLSAVNVFFVISGFIITTLLIREKEASGQVSLTGFYSRRFFRIVPPFAVYLLALVAVRAAGVIVLSNQNLVWATLFLGDAAVFDDHAWMVSHTWSLAVEEQFYLLLPPLLCLVFNFRLRAFLIALCASYGVSLVSMKLAHELAEHVHPQLFRVWEFYRFRYIIVGVALATHGAPILRWLSDRSRVWPCAFAVAVVALQLVRTPTSVVSVFFAAIEPLFCALFVMWFMQNPSRCGFLRSPVVQWIGACSYSIYLWQQLFTASPDYYLKGNPAATPLAILPILACAAASYYFVERPSIRLGRLLTRPGRAPVEAPSPAAGPTLDRASP